MRGLEAQPAAGAEAQLQQQETATAEELQDKFVHDGKAFTLQLGGLDKFYGGLEAIVGAPKPKVLEGMENLPPKNDTEERILPRIKRQGPNVRLACQCVPSGDVAIRIVPEEL